MEWYEIRVEGHLSLKRQASFNGLTATWLSSGETVLAGFVADQAALHGILRRISDLGLTLVFVKRSASDETGHNSTQNETQSDYLTAFPQEIYTRQKT